MKDKEWALTLETRNGYSLRCIYGTFRTATGRESVGIVRYEVRDPDGWARPFDPSGRDLGYAERDARRTFNALTFKG